MKELLSYLVLFLLLGCYSNREGREPVVYDYVLVKYEDSTYKKPVDSLYVKNSDTLFITKKFPVKGYFKVYDSGKSSYSMGELNKENKVGKWIYFQKYGDQWVRKEESNYNESGKLNGKFIIYDLETGNISSIHNYLYSTYTNESNEAGIQKEFYPSGKIHIQYEKDDAGNFINTYAVYSKNGEILFKEELGSTGTGYIKFYDKDNLIEWEGRFVNKKKQGWHRNYLSDAFDNDILIEDKVLYNEDTMKETTQIFLKKENNPELNGQTDSINYKYFIDKTKVTYYSNGKIRKEEIVGD